jgi:hypothetical protein
LKSINRFLDDGRSKSIVFNVFVAVVLKLFPIDEVVLQKEVLASGEQKRRENETNNLITSILQYYRDHYDSEGMIVPKPKDSKKLKQSSSSESQDN